jgi:crossover junction endodeoxyribonuclease RuvC
MIFCGIDPGVTGAISFVGNGKAVVVDLPTVEIPGNGRSKSKLHGYGLVEIIRRNIPAGETALVILEDVHAMPSTSSGSAANTSLMHSKGVIEGVLSALRLEIRLVNSRTWKGLFGLGSDKNESIACALKLYPNAASSINLKKHHNRSEALLLAHYGLKEFA